MKVIACIEDTGVIEKILKSSAVKAYLGPSRSVAGKPRYVYRPGPAIVSSISRLRTLPASNHSTAISRAASAWRG